MTVSLVIIKGRYERKEFNIPFRQCTEMFEIADIEYRINPANTIEPADFVLFFQSYPHEFSQAELSRLRSVCPDAPFFFVLGICCEGMLRTVGPIYSPFYRYVHAWSNKEIEQIRLFLQGDHNGVDDRWHILESSRDENNVVAHNLPFAASYPLPQHVLILTHFGPFGNDSAMNQLIFDEQKRLGGKPIFSGKLLPETFAGTIFADADDSPMERILESIRRLRCLFADNDFTVYLNSPRIDEKDGYTKAGVTRILPKIR